MTRLEALPPDIMAVAAKLEPAIQQAFLLAVARLRSAVRMQDLVAAIRAADIDAALAVLALDRANFGALDRAVSAAHFEGGMMAEAAAQRLRLAPQPFAPVGLFGFDARHPRAEALVRNHAGQLIEGIIDDQRLAVRTYLTQAIAAGQGPDRVALDIVGRIDRATGQRTGGIIGLTSQQALYVSNTNPELPPGALQQLRSNDPAQLRAYLTRVRRDARYDHIIRTAIQTGKPISATDIDRMTMRYKDRLLQLRGETIARTEAITGLRAGRHEGYKQLVESGRVRSDQVIRTWRSTRDGRTRVDHLLMHGTELRGLDTPFTAPDESQLAFPGDTSLGASARETINCRCHLDYQIDRRRGLG